MQGEPSPKHINKMQKESERVKSHILQETSLKVASIAIGELDWEPTHKGEFMIRCYILSRHFKYSILCENSKFYTT